MRRAVLYVTAVLVILIAGNITADAAQTISATLTARPTSFSGKCPAVIDFKGRIAVTEPGRIQYTFIRSDGAAAPVQIIDFAQPGSKPVSATWRLGGAALPNYEGWEAIKVLHPQQLQSDKAVFGIQCTDVQSLKKPDVGMYGFLKIGRFKKEVIWNETIVLTPDDATLVSGGKPAFEIYYSIREGDGAAVPGPFKNKMLFNGNLVGQQTNLSLAPSEIRDIHTQAYLGPQPGKLRIKIDADNEVSESREDNNFSFFVNLIFRGF